MSESGHRAAANIRHLCSEVLGDAVTTLDIIDLREHPELSEEDAVLATPTLIRRAPPPPRRLVGDLTDLEYVAAALDINAGPDRRPRGAHACSPPARTR